jgi:UDP-N-acetylmuramyl pentapeptide phosphotransferase/UDP-N-acetylglucosamine-1-phosphate transferase
VAAWLLFHVLVGASGAWLARRYALRRNLVDLPGERRSHSVPTPRSGGVGIVGALLSGGVLLLLRDEAAPPVSGLAITGFGMVAAIGLADDHRPLSPWLRLAVHALAASLLALGTWWTWHDPWLSIAAFGLALVLTNVWNFMDGIDGIATSQAMLVALAIVWAGFDNWTTWLAAALVAACLGFLPFNFPKARLFLGDVASGAIGFLLAALLIAGMADAGTAAWATWLLPPSAFLIDASLTLAGRLLRREPWWRPHALHAYQRWAKRVGSHVPVTLAYAAWTMLACALALSLRKAEYFVMLAASAAWYIAGAGMWWVLQKKGLHAVEDRE